LKSTGREARAFLVIRLKNSYKAPNTIILNATVTEAQLLLSYQYQINKVKVLAINY